MKAANLEHGGNLENGLNLSLLNLLKSQYLTLVCVVSPWGEAPNFYTK